VVTVLYLTDTHVSTPDSPLRGGAENQLYLLATSLDPDLFRPIVVQLSTHKPLPLSAGRRGATEFYTYPMGKFYDFAGLQQISQIFRLAREKRVDVVHTFFEKSEVIGWILSRLSAVPVWITSRRDLGFKRKEIYTKLFRLSGSDCKRCVANCQAIKDQMIQREKVPPKKIDVIYNGLDFSHFSRTSERSILREELGIGNGVPLVGMVANFYAEIKGHKYFLEAAKSVLERVSEVEFVLVGDGPLRHSYEEMTSQLGIQRHVHFLGKRGDVPAILSSLTVSVLSSTSEGLSNVILESMAAGKPVVATRVGGSPEMVVDGVTGYLVSPADSDALARSISSLLQNQEKADAMGIKARKVVNMKFTVKAMVESYERLYESLKVEFIASRR
jgi:glycosyltransferase involved in cell wall biosynthesis